MGSLDSRVLSGAGTASALLFIVAGALSLVEGVGSIAPYVAAVAGILAIVFSIDSLTSGAIFAKKVSGATLALAGVLALVSAFSADMAGTVVAVTGVAAAVSMLFDSLDCWVSKVKGLMTVSGLFAVVEFIVSIVALTGGGVSLKGIVLVILGLWIVVRILAGRIISGSPDEKPSAEKTDGKAVSDKSDKVKAPVPKESKPVAKDAIPQKPVEVSKEESRKVVEPKPISKDELRVVSPESDKPPIAKVDPVKKETSVPQSVPPVKSADPKVKVDDGPKPTPQRMNNDFMGKLVASRNVHKATVPKVEVPVEPEPAETAPVKEVPTDVETMEVEGGPEPVVEPSPSESVVEEKAEGVIVEPTEPDVPKCSESDKSPEEASIDTDDVDDSPVQAEEAITKEDASTSDEAITDPSEEMCLDGDGTSEEVSPIADADADQSATFTPDDVVDEPVAEVTDDVVGSSVSEPEGGSPSEESGTVTEDDPSVGSPESPDAEDEIGSHPSPENSDLPVDGTVLDDVDEEIGEDIFTDYSPEALVRRAAWNKGLRCRRGYGDHNIPVAFVKGRVAVYVEDADADTSTDQVLRDEGWTVLRYDSSTITDGKDQAEEISQAVKANMRAAKSSSKKKKKTSKK